MEGRSGNGEMDGAGLAGIELAKVGVDFLNFIKSGAFGFVGDGDASKMEIGWKMLLATFF